MIFSHLHEIGCGEKFFSKSLFGKDLRLGFGLRAEAHLCAEAIMPLCAARTRASIGDQLAWDSRSSWDYNFKNVYGVSMHMRTHILCVHWFAGVRDLHLHLIVTHYVHD